MACTSAGDSKELSGLVALKATSSASLLFLANRLHNSNAVTGKGKGGGGEQVGTQGRGGRGGEGAKLQKQNCNIEVTTALSM